MGDDTVYSGTVAAAMEGFLLGIPSVAISLASKQGGHYADAAKIARRLVEKHRDEPFRNAVLLNVNVPDVPYEQIKGIEITRLGRRHKAEGVVKATNPRGQSVYWIGAAGDAQDAGEGTDFHSIANNLVSITPLQIDLTHYRDMDEVRQWLGNVFASEPPAPS
jgi:5'-nucleotidase